MLKHVLLYFGVFCFLCQNTIFASPFVLGTFTYRQPNGFTFSIQKFEDEFGIYESTTQDLVVKNEIDGYYYFANYFSDGKLLASQYQVGVSDESSRQIIKSIRDNNYQNWIKYSHKDRMSSTKKPSGAAKIAAVSIPDSLIVILVDFTPNIHRTSPSAYTRANFDSLLFGTYNTTSPDGDNVYGSMKQYYKDMSAAKSGGSWILKGRIANIDSNNALNWVTLPHTKGYYDTLSTTDGSGYGFD